MTDFFFEITYPILGQLPTDFDKIFSEGHLFTRYAMIWIGLASQRYWPVGVKEASPSTSPPTGLADVFVYSLFAIRADKEQIKQYQSMK